MVKKSAVILGILAILLVGAGMSQGYTVMKWPVPGIPNVTFGTGQAQMICPTDVCLKGPVAPACCPSLLPGLIHGALSVPFRAVGLVATPLFTGASPWGTTGGCGKLELDGPAYVTAAVPCTPVNCYARPQCR